MLDFRSLVPFGQRSRQAPALGGDVRDPFAAFRREMDRLFEDFVEGFDGRNSALTPWGTTTPQLDIHENEKEVVVKAELPGLDEKDFEVTLAGDLLTIKGEKRYEHDEKDGERHYVERRYGAFSRSVRLPFEAGEQDVSAEYDKGVLTVRIPKPAEAQNKVKRIEVKAH